MNVSLSDSWQVFVWRSSVQKSYFKSPYLDSMNFTNSVTSSKYGTP